MYFLVFFLKVNVQNGDILGRLLKFKILIWVCLVFLVFFAWTVDAGLKPTY